MGEEDLNIPVRLRTVIQHLHFVPVDLYRYGPDDLVGRNQQQDGDEVHQRDGLICISRHEQRQDSDQDPGDLVAEKGLLEVVAVVYPRR